MADAPSLAVFKRVVGQWRPGRLTLHEAGQAILEAVNAGNVRPGMALLSPALLEEVKRHVDSLPHTPEGWERLQRWYIGVVRLADGGRPQRGPFPVPAKERERLRMTAELLRAYFATMGKPVEPTTGQSVSSDTD